MEHFKMSTSRDFRINAQSLQAAIEAQEEVGEEDEEEDSKVEDNMVHTMWNTWDRCIVP